jgi:hypothetical protein
MAVNLIIEGIIQDCIFRARNEDNWNDYKMSVMINIYSIDLEKKIENYKPCGRYLYVPRPRMIDILYQNIILNNNIFEELFKGGIYPKKKQNITGTDVWGLVELCMMMLVNKQQLKN